MTRHEAAVVSAYTGILVGDRTYFEAYVGALFGREMYPSDFMLASTLRKIKAAATKDFEALEVTDGI